MANASRRGQAPDWTVVVEPCGTPAEAAEAARQARRLVAEWIARDHAAGVSPGAGDAGAEPGAGDAGALPGQGGARA